MRHHGSLHVLRLGHDPNTGEERFSITYARYDRRGGALPPYVVRGERELLSFLENIGVDKSAAESLLAEMGAQGRGSLPNVVFTDEQLRRYGLGEMGIIQSVISYLST
jgi:hypothetical protein